VRLSEKVIETFAGLGWGRDRLDSMLFAPGVDTLHNQFVHRMEVAVSDFFLHQSLGFQFELHRHVSTLAASVAPRKRNVQATVRPRFFARQARLLIRALRIEPI
jgi:hypothetical protein